MRRTCSAANQLVMVAAIALSVVSCGAGSKPLRKSPVAVAASEAVAATLVASRLPGFASDEDVGAVALAELQRAEASEPDWPAPSRLVDELVHRPALTLPGRYGAHLAAMEFGETREARAAGAYLAGRLGGKDADARLELALQEDPALGWAYHGLAWRQFRAGRTDGAFALGATALDLARDPSEVAHFGGALADYARDGDRNEAAIERLMGALGSLTLEREASGNGNVSLAGTLARGDLEADLALSEMNSSDEAVIRRGVARVGRLLVALNLAHADRLGLLVEGLGKRSNFLSDDEAVLALLDGRKKARSGAERARFDNLIETIESGSVSERRRRADAAGSWRVELSQAFGAGEGLEAMRRWLETLPPWLLSETGIPKRLELQVLLRSLEAEANTAEPEARRAVGDALIAAGWFTEAKAYARFQLNEFEQRDLEHSAGDESVPASDEVASDLYERAVEGRAALSALRALASRIDMSIAFVRSGQVDVSGIESIEGEQIESLTELEDEVERLLFRASSGAAGAAGPGASPRIRYGPLGAVLHPGPTYTAEDESQGRGLEGEPVPGVAALFGRLGRFALIGQGVGQGGPDATILRLISVESRSGEHLGRPFHGTVFWCEGADVPGRFARRGAAISGAALHEGYYIDLAQVRREKVQWDAVRERFDGRADALTAALGVRGAQVARDLRVESTPALGAADRVRLAVMSEPTGASELKGAGQSRLGSLRELQLAAFAHVVATHEEGHLCDRAAWYPITFRRSFRLLSFAAAHGFSPARLARALEARAQLVAVASVDDPRVALVDLLDAAESTGGPSVTPHGGAYRRLLDALLRRLDAEYAADEYGWRDLDLDPDRRWIDQLHRVPAESIRGLATREAKARGLTG